MNSALVSWGIPPDLLIAALTTVLGYLFKRILSDSKDTKEALATLALEQQTTRLAMKDFATLEQLGRWGDRVDGRITNAEAKIAVAMDRWERK